METREQMVAWTDVWTDPTLVFSGAGTLLHTNVAAQRVFSDSEREEVVRVWEHIQAHPELHPFAWSNAAGSAAYTVHPGQVDGCYFAVFKDAREHGESVAALNHNKLLYSGLANGTIEGLALVNQGKVMDSNPQFWRVIGVSNALELTEVNLSLIHI